MKHHYFSWLLAAAFCSVLAPRLEAAVPPRDLVVLAAASLKEVLEGVDAIFERENPGVHVVLSLGGSQKLSAQLQQGAPGDVFASAATKNMDDAVVAGVIAKESVTVFARNSLVAVYSLKSRAVSGNPVLQDLSKPGIKLAIADKSVPVGDYTSKVVEKARLVPELGSPFTEGFKANVVSYETDVRSVLNKVVLGEVDAGIVYQSDLNAVDAKAVGRIEIPSKINVQAVYPIGSVRSSANGQLASRYIQLVLSAQGKALLKQYGFSAP